MSLKKFDRPREQKKERNKAAIESVKRKKKTKEKEFLGSFKNIRVEEIDIEELDD